MTNRLRLPRSGLIVAVLATCSVAGGAIISPAAGVAAVRVPCSARMFHPAPAQYSTTDVLVSTAASASVSATAHYKTTNTTHPATSNAAGKADLPFRISRATTGYRVVVTVTVRKGRSFGSCSTAFTPR